MGIQGRKDEDDSKKASLEKARANGFGQKGVAGRKKLNANDIFEEAARERLPKLVEKSFDAIERALDDSNNRVALDAYYKLHKTYYQPDKKIVVEGGDTSVVHNNLLIAADGASEKEKELLAAFTDLMKQGHEEQELVEANPDEDVIEGEALEIRDDDE